MAFTSPSFLIFFIVVFCLLWSLGRTGKTAGNFLLLIASYFFYGFWDWRFLPLLAIGGLFNFTMGILIGHGRQRAIRKLWLIAGLAGNTGLLFYFKYLDFLNLFMADLLNSAGVKMNPRPHDIILPLGISFITFLSISYLVDVYRRKLLPEKNVVDLALSLSFFPIVTAGPIQRPVTLIPQIRAKRVFIYDTAVDGLRQVLWGLFAKVVVADNCAIYVNEVFAMKSELTSSAYLLGAILFTIQIYADFSAYSNMAIGTARLLGFNLMQNFNYPYFAKDIADFWRRWHISLTSWFRDYVFLPISYYISGKIKRSHVLLIRTDLVIYIIGMLLTWFLTGLWHGANITFILWGIFHAIFLVTHQFTRKWRKRLNTSRILMVKRSFQVFERILTLALVVFTMVIFRSDSIERAANYLGAMFSGTLYSKPEGFSYFLLIPVVFYFLVEWFQRKKQHGLEFSGNKKYIAARWSFYMLILLLLFLYQKTPQEFYYFRF
jgi:D-alanyl-lipoteichoic acid acyltransferase DltB (MBOAT superfamily)